MKKARSSTKQEKELRDIVLNLGVAYIKRFTNNQLNKFIDKPVVIPVGNYRFFVGPYVVNGVHKQCWEVSKDGDVVHCFLSRLNAILYCLTCVKNRYWQSRDILEWDNKLGHLNLDLEYYTRSIKSAQNANDRERKEIMLNRYIDAKQRQKQAIDKLNKTIKSAKYINFGNMNNETN
jgi:hypothetical protein